MFADDEDQAHGLTVGGRALGTAPSGTLGAAEACGPEPAAEDRGPVVDQDGGSDLETD